LPGTTDVQSRGARQSETECRALRAAPVARHWYGLRCCARALIRGGGTCAGGVSAAPTPTAAASHADSLSLPRLPPAAASCVIPWLAPYAFPSSHLAPLPPCCIPGTSAATTMGMTDALKFEDSNLAGVGGETDAALRKSAAESEESFTGAGAGPGLEVWRIEKFEPTRTDASEHGTFYSGDAYIVLHTYVVEETDALAWNLHFWLGKDSTQDERGASAFFTVAIDDMLNGAPVQYRETEGHESSAFMKLFPVMRTLEGGVASGFTKVEPESYTPRLLHVFKTVSVKVKQVPLSAASLNHGDAFILDGGLKLWQFNGSGCGPFERRRASEVFESIKEERDGEADDTVIDGDEVDGMDDFWAILGGKGDIAAEAPEGAHGSPPVDPDAVAGSGAKKLYKVSDSTGELGVELVAEGDAIDASAVTPDDVWLMLVGDGAAAFMYAGAKCSRSERFMMAAQQDKILEGAGADAWTPVTTCASGTSAKWNALFA